MQVEQIRVEFTKTVSDGSYGNERHTVGLTVTVAEGETAMDWLHSLSAMLEEHVNSRLKQSRSDGIRSAVETTEEREARYARERREAKARWEREHAEREARLAEGARAVLTDEPGDDDSDDDDDDDGTPF